MSSSDPVVNPQIHLLIVEDSPTQAYKLRHLLLQHFGRVDVARNGAEALPMVRTTPPTLVISDVNMPEMNGYELCQRIKSDPELAAIPVILITTLSDPSDVVKGLECGACGFLSKPYDEDHLLTRIQFILANRDLRGTAVLKPETGVEIHLGDQKYFIPSGREQILDFLLSTYELALRKNRELHAATERLEAQTHELERSNRELEQFASIASHDLQEPLRMVSSYLGLLARRVGDRLDEKERSYIGFAVDGAQRMQQMISDLLTFSRAGTTTKAFAQADLTEIFERALTNLKVAREERNATVTHDPLPAAVVDASQFMQVFQNLIGNALKFCTGRPPQVHVSCERRDDEWVFAVRDNGIGIAEKDFERIFGIFHRLHSRAEFEGTGIGLALVKKIVERHGGRVWVESALGVGTTFSFTVPVEAESRGEARAQ